LNAAAKTHRRQHALLGALYAEDFDAPHNPTPSTPEPEPEPEIIEPVYTAADLDAARVEGRQAGLAESANGLAAARVKLLTDVTAGLQEGREACLQLAEAAAETIARTMLSALVACLPALCARHGETELRALARSLLPSLSEEKRIALRVNPLMVPGLSAEITALDPAIAESITLVGVEQMLPGDIKVTWQDGAAIRDTSQVRAAVEDALAALGLLEKEMLDA
jgi:flagellar biosynthesis/type III secretory pathway protein FliH